MKHQFYIAAMLTSLLFASCKNEAQQTNSATSGEAKDSVSYAIGIDIGNQLKEAPQGFNLATVAQAIQDIQNGSAKMTQQEAVAFLQMYQQREAQAQIQSQTQTQVQAEHNKAEGEAFLQENKGKEGVVTLPSGLQYKILKEGKGPKPKATDIVEVHYRGTLIDGTEFDSSHKGGKTVSFPLNQVIAGWTEGLQHINEGSTVMFYIPQELAYGANPRPGGPIEPYMALIFEIELVKVNP